MLSLLKNIDKYTIILASQSPRRYELLKMIGLDFKVCASFAKESYEDHLSPIEYVLQNARKKGEMIAAKEPESIIISADTIVVLRDKILEKPENAAHAQYVLNRLSGVTHQVVTGFGFILLSENKQIFDHEITHVTFRKLSPQEIRAYIESGEPFDKAGGYGAQGLGSLLIEKVDGCFFNVVGLPLAKFFTTLDNFLVQI